MAFRKPQIAISTTQQPLPAADQLWGDSIQLSLDAGNTLEFGSDRGLLVVGEPAPVFTGIVERITGVVSTGSPISGGVAKQVILPTGTTSSFFDYIDLRPFDLTKYSLIYVEADIGVKPQTAVPSPGTVVPAISTSLLTYYSGGGASREYSNDRKALPQLGAFTGSNLKFSLRSDVVNPILVGTGVDPSRFFSLQLAYYNQATNAQIATTVPFIVDYSYTVFGIRK